MSEVSVYTDDDLNKANITADVVEMVDNAVMRLLDLLGDNQVIGLSVKEMKVNGKLVGDYTLIVKKAKETLSNGDGSKKQESPDVL